MKKTELLKELLEHKKTQGEPTALNRMIFVIVGIGIFMTLAFSAYFVWFILTNKGITSFLPATKTIAYAELENLSLPTKLDGNIFSNLINSNNIFQKNIKIFQKSIVRGKAGVAMVQDQKNANQPVFFFHTYGKSRTLKYFESLGLANEKLTATKVGDNIIYSYPQSRTFVFSFIGPYVFAAENSETIQIIQSVYEGKTANLDTDADYQKTLSNLPKQAWGKGYINIKSLSLSSQNPLNQMVDPLKYIINHFALTIKKQPSGFHFNTLLSVNPKMLPSGSGYTGSTGFAYKLADFIGYKNLAVYMGGENLSDEWSNTLKTISQLNPAYGIILEGILNAQISKIFGDNVSLRDDIYPLLDGEYALVLENLPAFSAKSTNENDIKTVNKSSELGIKLILKHSDKKFAEIKLQKLLKGFRMLAAQFSPQLRTISLPKGQSVKELLADSAQIKETNTGYKGYTINCLDVVNSAYGFCYTITDTLIVMSSNTGSIEETIDLGSNTQNALSQSRSFRQSLSNLSAVSDEITFIDFNNINKLLANTQFSMIIKNPLAAFDSIAWVKHYFNDGASSDGYLLLK